MTTATTERYIVTRSGRTVSRETGVPSLGDIALGLSRICRFAGQGQRFFSVLAHTLWMDDRYRDLFFKDPNPAIRLGILLHDAHEACVSDTPSPLKTGEAKLVQRMLEARIFARYYEPAYGAYRDSAVEMFVKDLDQRAFEVEYYVVGPGHHGHGIYFGPKYDDDYRFLRQWLKDNKADLAAQVEDDRRHPIVREYLRRLGELL